MIERGCAHSHRICSMRRISTSLVCCAFLWTCGPPEKLNCENGTCSGCCAADGTCLQGDAVEACGSAEALCVACEPGQECSSGKCVRTAAPIPGVDRVKCSGYGNVEGTINTLPFLGRTAWVTRGLDTIGIVVTNSTTATPSEWPLRMRFLQLAFDYTDGTTQYSSALGSNTFRPAWLQEYTVFDAITMQRVLTRLGESGFRFDVTELVFASESKRCDGQLRGILYVSDSLNPVGAAWVAQGAVAVPLSFTRADLASSVCSAPNDACTSNATCCSGYCRPANNTCQ